MKKSSVANRPDLQKLFSRIAGRYDLINTVLGFNQAAHWRRRTIELAGPKAGQYWLDVCCGTGELTLALCRRMNRTGRVVGLDFAAAMLDVAKQKEVKEYGSPFVEWVEADAMNMPFDERQFDGLTIGCGLRNLPDFDAALTEFARVLKPGGKFVCMDLSLPQQPIWRQLYRFYLRTLFATAGNLGLGPDKNYDWVLESLDQFPTPQILAGWIEQKGFTDVQFEQFAGGLATIHHAVRKS